MYYSLFLEFIQPDNYETARKNLVIYCNFFKKYNYDPEIELLNKIFGICEVFKKSLACVIEHDITLLKEKDIDQVYKSDMISSLVNASCICYDVDLNDEEKQDDNNQDSSLYNVDL